MELIVDANILLAALLKEAVEIETIPKKAYISHMAEALKIAPHKEDAPYLALALAYNVPIWSNDKGIHSQSKIKVFSTREVLKLLVDR